MAEWAAEPISTGNPGLALTPVVFGLIAMVLPAVAKALEAKMSLADLVGDYVRYGDMLLETLSTTKAAGMAEGKAEGKAQGKAEDVLAILDARAVAVPDGERERITTCTDVEQLDGWIRRAATAHKIEELFA